MNNSHTFIQIIRIYNRSRRKLLNLLIEGKNLRKQAILKKRIAKWSKYLISIKLLVRTGISTTAISAGLMIFQPNMTNAQALYGPYVANPFGLTEIYTLFNPSMCDLDGDGDLDLFAGQWDGNLKYFNNNGNAISPLFTEGVVNPYGLSDIGINSNPVFADLDNDGDFDLLVGEHYGNFKYFQNIGTDILPSFAPGVTNPFGLTDIGSASTPTFSDLDDDGDFDLLSGEGDGTFWYFQNIGTDIFPSFAPVLMNPFGLVSWAGSYTYNNTPSFGDLDNDGDMDVVAGNAYGSFRYYENIGTSVAPAFGVESTNPFGLISLGYDTSPVFVDLDSDGDMDLLAGASYYYNESFFYFENFTACTEPMQPYFADLDNDGFGAGASLGVSSCDSVSINFSFNDLDCNDCFANNYPGSTEICDGIDNNCDGSIDEGFDGCNPGPAIEWQNTIGGSGADQINYTQQTADGGYILAGYSSSNISGDKTEPHYGVIFPYDYWIVKVNSTGEIEWQNTIGGTKDDKLFSVQQTSDGGYILGGYSLSGISGDKTEGLIGGAYAGDYWVIKLNSSGAIEWQNTIGGNADDYLYSIQQTLDGGYILGGSSSSGISGDKTESAFIGEFGYAYPDYWVVKLNSSGGIEWQNTIGGSEYDWLRSIQQTIDGGYILGGYSDSGISGDKTENILGYQYAYWVVKINSTGGIEWQNTIGGNVWEILYSIDQTLDGGYILGGYSASGISGDKTEAAIEYTSDYWVVKLDNIGNIEWQNTIGGNGGDELKSLQQTTDGGYILGGQSYSGISGDKSETRFGPMYSYDYWIVKLDLNGNIEWQNTIGGKSSDYLTSVQQTADEGYILSGYNYGYTSGCNGDQEEATNGNTDYWIIKLAPDCLATFETCNSLDDNCNGLIDDGITETISISAGGATTFCQGGSVILTATHSGTSLQWKKNGVNIAGATGITYTATKTGDYTCETSSICGTATSALIHVKVNKNPSASITAGGATTFCAGGSVTLTVTTVTGSSYQWYKGASAIAGATTTTYIANTAGNYKCRVTKTASGCFKNSNTIAVTVPCKEGEVLTTDDLLIYPNPATGQFTLEYNTTYIEQQQIKISIANILGEEIFYKAVELINGRFSEEINLINIAAGIYSVTIKSDTGIVAFKKLIIN